MFLAATLVAAAAPRAHQLTTAYTYAHYVRDHGKAVAANSTEWALREQIFAMRLRDIIAHNKAGGMYKKGVNKFTDMTDKERRRFLGGRVRANRLNAGVHSVHEASGAALPDHVDWRLKGKISPVKDQASCGSCWAHAAVEAIESSAAINSQQDPQVLSRQQIVACTPNPKHCGGSGGCGGATAELGYEYVASVAGITTEDAYPYTAGGGDSGTCQFSSSSPIAAKVLSYTTAKVNDLNSTMSMIATMGPASIGVAASAWFDYESGVFNGCESSGDQDMNHGVQVVGYTGSAFIVRNSWGPGWGEQGFIRIHRVDTCYTDNEASDGSACSGDPQKIQVCGPCGLYYEVSWPVARYV